MVSHDPVYGKYDEIQDWGKWYEELHGDPCGYDREDALEGWD